MNVLLPVGSSQPAGTSLAYQVIPARSAPADLAALAVTMQGLALSARHPLALELAGTAEEQRWIVRAGTQEALAHALSQLQARYPQAAFVPLSAQEDPFHLAHEEAVSALELKSGAPAYVPLRPFLSEQPRQSALDPLPGVLAALSQLPVGTRALVQLALVPASPTWAKGKGERLALEHPLSREREQQRKQAATSSGMPLPLLIALTLLLGAILFLRFTRQATPSWVLLALAHLVHGQPPALSAAHAFQFYGGAVLWLGGSLVLALGFRLLRRRFSHDAWYDPRLVSQQTGQMAYRVRLRLYVIGPAIQAAGRTSLSSWFGPCGVAVPGFPRVRLLQIVWQAFRERRTQAASRAIVLQRLVAAYRQWHQGSGGYFVPHLLSARAARRLLTVSQGWQHGVARSKQYLSVSTLAACWHLVAGQDLSQQGQVSVRSARTLLMPPEVARLAQGERILGYCQHAGHRLPFALTAPWLQAHALILGKSGEGKSTLLEQIAREAMHQGGLIVIDPHGDLVPRVLEQVPPHRSEAVVCIDLADPAFCVGLNPLDVTLGQRRDKAIADLLSTLSHIWLRSWGSRMENSFEFGLRTLWEYNRRLITSHPHQGRERQMTLLDLLPLYTSESFCHGVLQYVDDPYVHRWWRQFYEPLPLFMKREIINPVATKTAKFESEIARRIVGQPYSTLNLAESLRRQQILLIRLAKGVVGADAAPLLGATLLGLLSVCLEAQGALPEAERVHCPILIDEFQVLEGVDWSMLAQLRKYGATFFLATQSLAYLQKLDALLLPTVLANIRQLYCFNVSAQDAWTIHRELLVEPDDLVSLESHQCYVKLMQGEQRVPTFSLRINMPPGGDPTLSATVRQRSQQRYARPAEEVDAWLRQAVARQRSARVEIEGLAPARPALSSPAVAWEEQREPEEHTHAPRVRGRGGKGRAHQLGEATPAPMLVQRPSQHSQPMLFAHEADEPGEQED